MFRVRRGKPVFPTPRRDRVKTRRSVEKLTLVISNYRDCFDNIAHVVALAVKARRGCRVRATAKGTRFETMFCTLDTALRAHVFLATSVCAVARRPGPRDQLRLNYVVYFAPKSPSSPYCASRVAVQVRNVDTDPRTPTVARDPRKNRTEL